MEKLTKEIFNSLSKTKNWVLQTEIENGKVVKKMAIEYEECGNCGKSFNSKEKTYVSDSGDFYCEKCYKEFKEKA